MSKITITIDTNNDAFQNVSVDGMSHELPNILESLATYILENNELPEFIYDSNGNKCGNIIESNETEDSKQIEIDNLKAELKYFYGGGK